MFTGIRMWLRALLRRSDVESDMEKEMRIHLEMEAEANERAGMSQAAAVRAARVAFGGVDRAREEVRDARLTRWLENLISDVRFGMRGFRRTPAFALAVILLLALGIGANAALFSVMYKLIISPLPYPDGNRMVRVLATGNGGQFLLSVPRRLASDWSAKSKSASDIVLATSARLVLGDTASESPKRLWALRLTPGAMEYVHARPVLGRDIGPADTAPGAPPVALLGHSLWQSSFGGDSAVVGRPVLLNGEYHTIIGVVPPGFELPFLSNNDIFMALNADTSGVEVIAKLRPGFSTDDGNREIAALWRSEYELGSMKRDIPKLKRESDMVGSGIRAMVYVLVAAVSLVLFIAAANVANLLMSRSWNRRRELAVRSALGAERGRLFQQLFVESVLLALFGGVVGVVVAHGTMGAIELLQAMSGNEYLPTQTKDMQRVMLASTAGFSLVATLLFGLGPALIASATDLREPLKAGGRAIASGAFTRGLRKALVVTEVSLSVVLLSSATLLLRSLREMHTAEVGMTSRTTHGIQVRFPEEEFSQPAIRRDALRAILKEVSRVPGVEGVSYARFLPPDVAYAVGGFSIGDRELQLADSMRTLAANRVAPNLFAVTGMRILRGRAFSPSSALDFENGPAEVIVSESFARRFWAADDALGKRLRLGTGRWSEVVGVVNDIRIPAMSIESWQNLQVYQPETVAPEMSMIVVRSSVHTPQLSIRLKKAISQANPLVIVGDLESAHTYVARARKPNEFLLSLIGTFGAVALMLAAIGVHAVVSYAVVQRRREFGVRIALGAEPFAIMRMVHREGVILVGAGLFLGTICAMAGSRLLQAMLYGVRPGDPLTLLSVTTLLLGTALVATHVPARQAMRTNPVNVLRED